MNTRIFHFILGQFILLLTVALLCTGIPVVAEEMAKTPEGLLSQQQTEPGNMHFKGRFAGTYMVKEDPEGTAAHWRIITLTTDGNWFSIASVQNSIPEAPDSGFTDQQGIWKHSGPREITAKVLDFNFSTNDGSHIGNSVAIYHLMFNANFSQFSGEYSGKQFPVDQNPLDPDDPDDSIPFEGSLEGRRITIDN